MKTIALKNNKFEVIRVTGNPEQFGELKRFCGKDITITYETCPIDDYWNIMLDDCLQGKQIIVPNHDYILKLPDGFTVVDSLDINEYFEDYLPKDIENVL